MVSALDSGASGPGSSPGWGHCVVFRARHFTLTAPSPPRCINEFTGELNAGGNPAMD